MNHVYFSVLYIFHPWPTEWKLHLPVYLIQRCIISNGWTLGNSENKNDSLTAKNTLTNVSPPFFTVLIFVAIIYDRVVFYRSRE